MKIKNPKIIFVILSYTTDQKKLDTQLSAIGEYDVVIVKNDYTKLKIPKKKSIAVIQNKINLGFGGGANIGIKYAQKHGAEWIVILNDDILFTKKTLSHLSTVASSCDDSIIGPYAGYLDKKRYTTILESNAVKRIECPDYISGSFIAIKSDVFDRIGYFYEPYFLYYEDVDLSVRAKKAGFSLAHISLPDLNHTDAVRYKRDPRPHDYYLARNHLLFVWRHAPLSVKCHEIFRLPKTLFEHYRWYRKTAILGIIDFITRHFGKKEFAV